MKEGLMVEGQKRKIELKVRVNQQERELIEAKMSQLGTSNMAAYMRRMSITGYVLRLDLPELKEMVSLLRRCSNNLNQIAKRAHETGRTYTEDIEDLAGQLNRLWETSKEIMAALAKLN